MNPVRLRLLATAAIATASAFSQATGQVVLFNTLPQSQSSFWPGSSTSWGAQSFTTDSASTQLIDVAVSLKRSGSPGGNYELALWSSVSGKPGAKLYTIGTAAESTLSTSYTTVDFPGLSLDVSPNTQYWITTKSGTGGVQWASHLFGSAQTEVWNFTSNGGSSWNTSQSNYSFLMSVCAVPEPALEAVVVAGALVVLAAWRFGRRVES